MTPSVLDLLREWIPGAPLVTLAALGAAYGLAVRRTPRWPARRSVCFAAGLLALAVALLSGVDAWADRLQWVHMLQHTLLALVAPPLLAAGAPLTLALRRHVPGAAAVVRSRALGQPALGLLALAGTMLAVHLTGLYEASLRNAWLHVAEHLALVTAGLLFWAPLVGADPTHRVGAVARIGWLLALMAPMGALSAVLVTSAPRSTSYTASATALGVDPAADQRTAALVMWIGGTVLVTVAVLVLTAAALWQEETRMRRREALEARP